MALKDRLRKRVKEVSREVLGTHSKIARVARPVASAAAGYFAGPVGSMAVTALSHYGHQYAEGAAIRGGVGGRTERHGHDARQHARAVAQRTTVHSVIAGGIGSLASGVTSAVSGGSFFGGLAGGQAGSALLGGTGGLFGAAPVAGTSSGVSGIITTLGGTAASQGASRFITSYDQDPETGKTSTNGNGFDLGDFLEGIGGALGGGGSSSESSGSGNNSGGNPYAGLGLDAPKSGDGSWVPLLIIGGALLLGAA